MPSCTVSALGSSIHRHESRSLVTTSYPINKPWIGPKAAKLMGLTWLAYFCIRSWLEPVAAQTWANALIVLTTWTQQVGCQLRLGFFANYPITHFLRMAGGTNMAKLVLRRADLVMPKMRSDAKYCTLLGWASSREAVLLQSSHHHHVSSRWSADF